MKVKGLLSICWMFSYILRTDIDWVHWVSGSVWIYNKEEKNHIIGTSHVVQWIKLCALNAGCLDSISGLGTRSCTLQLRPGAAK